MTPNRLTVLLAGAHIGTLSQDRGGKLSFEYEQAWRMAPGALPLSLSMPLAAQRHAHSVVEAFLWGLLPDNDRILARWGQQFGVSGRSAFALIAAVGEDCAGAVQFVRPERLDALAATAAEEVEWLDERRIGDRLRALRADPAAWRQLEDRGQFSLAGAQPKTALLWRDGRWGIPAGRTPTTHILKPPSAEFDGHAENEHLCLNLARALGLPAAASQVQRFDGEVAIVVERYDRAFSASLAAAAAARAAALAADMAVASSADETEAPGPGFDDGGTMKGGRGPMVRMLEAVARASALGTLANAQPILRLHQEDTCQALGVRPTQKYQQDGGPSPAQIVRLLRQHSSRAEEDVSTFVDALILNWIIGGTDAHAKNYAILHGGGGRVRLAPLYDLASALAYPELDPARMTMAMRIGGSYRFRDIGSRQWAAFAAEVGLDEDGLRERVAVMAAATAGHLGPVLDSARQAGLDHPILDRFAARIAERAAACRRLMASTDPGEAS